VSGLQSAERRNRNVFRTVLKVLFDSKQKFERLRIKSGRQLREHASENCFYCCCFGIQETCYPQCYFLSVHNHWFHPNFIFCLHFAQMFNLQTNRNLPISICFHMFQIFPNLCSSVTEMLWKYLIHCYWLLFNTVYIR